MFSRSWKDYPKVIAAGGASLLGAFIGSPFLFLDFKKVLSDVSAEARSSHLSATGEGLFENLAWYIQNPLLETLSLTGLVLAGLGIIYCLFSKKKESWLLLIFPVCFLLFIASLNLRWWRWIIPVIPFFCIFAAHAVSRIVSWTSQGLSLNPKVGKITACILLLVVSVPLLKSSILQGKEMAAKDTRTLAREWVLENIPNQSRLLVEIYTPYLPKDWYRFYLVQNRTQLFEVDPTRVAHSDFAPNFRQFFSQVGYLSNFDVIHGEKIEYMILSNWYDRYLRDSKRFPEKYARIVYNYKKLMEEGTKIYETKSTPGKNKGPIIRVYRFD